MRGKNKIYTFIAGTAVLIILISFQNWQIVRFFESSAVRIMKPFMRASFNFGAFFRGTPVTIMEDDKTDKIRNLEFQIEKLTQDNDELRKALGFKTKSSAVFRGADVILYSKELGKEFLLINQGRRAGIQKGDAVLEANGFFVGVVEDAQDEYAKISIASNAGKTFDVEMLPSGAHAAAKGIGARAFLIELVPNNTPIQVGDFIGLLGPGGKDKVLVGEVSYVSSSTAAAFQDIHSTLLSHPELLKEVFITAHSAK